MTPLDEDNQHLSDPEASLKFPKLRDPGKRLQTSESAADLPLRRSNTALSSLFASTASLPASQAESRATSPAVGSIQASAFIPAVSDDPSLPQPRIKDSDDPTRLIAQAFVPHVAVLASADTDAIAKEKGLPGGFLQLIRPYGDLVSGKVTIRDSNGASKTWDDYGIRFKGLKDGLSNLQLPASRRSVDLPLKGSKDAANSSNPLDQINARTGGNIAQIEEVVDRHLSYAELQYGGLLGETQKDLVGTISGLPTSTSSFYDLYLRRLLSCIPMSPHETFSHPVGCVVAISSRSKSPIEELRRLYGSTNTGDNRMPYWVNNEYLRYYVLVHDEDHDDIAKSTALYEQMKRHFGLHCHLLRLRSAQCVHSDDDSIRLPISHWISAAEELAEIQIRGKSTPKIS
jgi:trafficking protein particle complex subunit 8